MVQIKLFDNEKETTGSVDDFLPTTDPEVVKRRVGVRSGQASLSQLGQHGADKTV